MEAKKKTVLVVDDERLYRELVAATIESIGGAQSLFKALEAKDGQEAYDILKRARFDDVDLVLSDIEMPQMDGLELARRIKAEMAAFPIVLMTGNLNAHKTAADSMGITVLSKPFNGMLLESVIFELLSTRRG